MALRLTRALAALSTTVVAAAGLAAAADAAVAPRAPFTIFTVDAHPGWVIEGSRTYSDPTVSYTPAADPTARERLSMTGTSGAVTTVIGLTSLAGGFTKGTISLERDGFYDDAHGGIDMGERAGVGCSQFSGSLTVHQVDRDGTGALTAFGATYSAACDGGEPVAGELRWNSTIDHLRFGDVPFGTTPAPSRTVTVTAAMPTTWGTAQISGVDAYQFPKGADTCSGQTLDAGSACTITVTAPSTMERPRYAQLTLPSTSGDPARIVSMTSLGHDTPLGAFATVTGGPRRILDTRSADGVTTRTPLGAGRTIALQVTGRGNVPGGGVSAVVMNLTAVSPSVGGFLTVYPGPTKPNTSSINFSRGTNLANLVTVPVGTDGKVRITNGGTGTVHVLADVVGYYRTSASTTMAYGSFRQTQLQRIVDTRSEGGPLPTGYYFDIWLDYDQTGQPAVNEHLKAVAVNLTTTTQSGSGFLTAWSGTGTRPTASSINFVKARSQANMAVVPLRQEYDGQTNRFYPTFRISNTSGASTNVIVDVVGLYDDNETIQGWPSQRFHPLASPVRIVDTRSSKGTTKLTAGAMRTVQAPASIAGDNTFELVANLTTVAPTATTYLTAWASGTRPNVSNLNTVAKVTMANMAIVPLALGNTFRIHNAAGSTDVLLDVAGTMDTYPGELLPTGSGPSRSGATGTKAPSARFGVTRATTD
jgi:hypothetical protein